MIHLLKPTAIMIITFIVSFQGQSGTGTLYQVAFVLVQMFNYLKITVSQLLEMVDLFYYYLSYFFVNIHILYLLRKNFFFYFYFYFIFILLLYF